MELTTEPDTYSPSVDAAGNYVDKLFSFHLHKGIRCPCGSRKDKIYETQNVFSQHIKTKIHQKWLVQLNDNKANYYVENENLKNTLQQQRLIIAKMDKELQNKVVTIDYLIKQLVDITGNKEVKLGNLIDFD